MDMMAICLLPQLITSAVLAGLSCPQWWDETETNIFDEWDKLTLQQVKLWQYCVNKRFSLADRIASSWLKVFIYKSSTDSLRAAVAKKYDKIHRTCKGGVMYLYLTLCAMFHMNKDVKKAMLDFIDIFKTKGLANYAAENVLQASEELSGVCKRLDAVRALTDEHVFDVCLGMSICKNTRFHEMFKLLAQKADLGETQILPSISAYASPLEQVEAVLEKATDVHDFLCTAGEWMLADKSGTVEDIVAVSYVPSTCWNCGNKNCNARICKKPRDQARIDKNRAIWLKAKNENDVEAVPSEVVKTSEEDTSQDKTASSSTSEEDIPTPSPAPTTTPTPAPAPNTDSIVLSRRDLEAKIARLEMTSTDPNMSTMASMIRTMLLD